MFLSINLLLAIVSLSLADQKSECSDEFKVFGECMQSSNLKPITWKLTLMKDVDDCFMNTGCSKKPSEYGCDDLGCQRGGPGGRAGPLPDKCKCFKSVGERLQSEYSYTNCMKNKDPDYDCNCSEQPNRDLGGGSTSNKQCGWMPPRDAPVDVLASFCDGDSNKAKQVSMCIKDAFGRNKPDREDAKVYYASVCKADRVCRPRLGKKCEDKMKTWERYTCECQEEYRMKAMLLHHGEQTCTSVNLPPGFEQKIECNRPIENFCEQSFDQYYDSL